MELHVLYIIWSELVEDLNILDPVRWGQPAGQPSSYSSSSQLAGKAADTDDGAGRSSFGIFSHPPSLMHCINSTHRDTNCLTSVINTIVEGVNGYGILTDNGTCLNHLKYPVTHNLISYRDYHQSLLLHMHSPLGGIVHAFYMYQSYWIHTRIQPSLPDLRAHLHESIIFINFY